MIIKMSKAEQTTLDEINQEYNRRSAELVDRMIKESVNDPDKIREALRELDAERNMVCLKKYHEFEDIRFNKNLSQSPKKIKDDAVRQVNAIISKLVKIAGIGKPQKPMTPQKAEHILQNILNNPRQTDKQILSRIESVPPLFDEIMKDLQSSKGEMHRLNPDTIVKLIQTDLHRHYEKLDTKTAGEITDYIEQKVSEIIVKNDFPYLPVIKDAVFNSIIPAVAKKKKLTENGTITFLEVNGIRYSFTGNPQLLEHFGRSMALLFVMAVSEFAKNPNKGRETVSFPTIPLLTRLEGTLDISNSQALNNAIYEYRHGPLQALRYVEINIDSVDADGIMDGSDGHIIQKTRINKNEVTVQFATDFAEYYRSIKSKGYFPLSFFNGDKRDLNALAIENKLWSNGTMKSNIISGQAEIISVRSLLQETNLMTPDEIETRYASRWRKRVREPLEDALQDAMKSGEFDPGWYYCKSKGLRLNSQDIQKIDTSFTEWCNNTYIHYEIKNQELKNIIVNGTTGKAKTKTGTTKRGKRSHKGRKKKTV